MRASLGQSQRPFPPVTSLLSHEPPMLLVDEIVEELPAGLVCKVEIREDFVFLRGSEVDAVVCVELVAQAVGCCFGLADVRQNDAPRGGLVVGCRDARFFVEKLHLGDELLVRVRRVWARETAASFSGEVLRGDQLLASVELAVVAGTSTLSPAPGGAVSSGRG